MDFVRQLQPQISCTQPPTTTQGFALHQSQFMAIFKSIQLFMQTTNTYAHQIISNARNYNRIQPFRLKVLIKFEYELNVQQKRNFRNARNVSIKRNSTNFLEKWSLSLIDTRDILNEETKQISEIFHVTIREKSKIWHQAHVC